MHRLTRLAFSLALCVVLAMAVSARGSRPWIDMGLKDEFAIDQPVVRFEVFQQLASGVKGSSLGPSGGGFFFVTNQFILDTGATSIIAINEAERELRRNGYITENTVLEQGVAGFSELDVSAPYYLEIRDSTGSVVALPNTRIMSGQFPDLFTVNGIVGMPGMVGRVVTLDTSVWAGIEDIFDIVPMNVYLSNSLPASGGHRYSVPVVAREFEVVGDPPLPAASPIPMLEMSVGFGALDASGSFILDTGAAISFISSNLGIAIGLDSNADGVLDTRDEQCDGTLPVGGIGGTIEVPIFYIDRFTVPTEQGIDLVWNLESSLSVAIVDIHPAIDGVLGSDLLTSGWFNLFEIGEGSSLGPLQQVHFDFRQLFAEGDTGKVYFDLTPEFDVVQVPDPGGMQGDFNGDGQVDAADYVVWRKTGGSPQQYTTWRESFNAASSTWPGDLNGDGVVDGADYVVWRKAGGSPQEYEAWRSSFGIASSGGSIANGAAGVPEPATVALAALAVVGAVLRLPRRGQQLLVFGRR